MQLAAQGAGHPIVGRQDFSDVTFLLEVSHPMLAKAARPGQFVIVMSHPEGERMPLTIADYDRERGTITLVIQAVGKTTREMQRDCKVGGQLLAMVGPMGMPSHIGKARKVMCVGGGLGVAPIYPQARLQGKRRLRHWHRRLPQPGPRVLGRQVRRGLRRIDHLHGRRFGRHQGPRGPAGSPRKSRSTARWAGKAFSRPRAGPCSEQWSQVMARRWPARVSRSQAAVTRVSASTSTRHMCATARAVERRLSASRSRMASSCISVTATRSVFALAKCKTEGKRGVCRVAVYGCTRHCSRD